jgi:hypothetical protein
MDAIYGPTGAVVGWLAEFDRVYGLAGTVTGWIDPPVDDDGARPVYSLRGRHVGWLTHGLFWDHSGCAVAFLVGASGGPPKPERQLYPVQPVAHLAPARPAGESPKPPAPRRPQWSTSSFMDLLTRSQPVA